MWHVSAPRATAGEGSALGRSRGIRPDSPHARLGVAGGRRRKKRVGQGLTSFSWNTAMGIKREGAAAHGRGDGVTASESCLKEGADMTCHLMEQTSFGSNADLPFETVERYVQSDHFDLFLCKCTRCGQLYVGCYVEVTLVTGDEWEDDHWNFYVPVEPLEVDGIRAAPQTAVELIQSRRHITWYPGRTIRWAEGPEIPFMMS